MTKQDRNEDDESGAKNLSEREEIEMLLPWFVTDQLDDADTKRVATYLGQHPDMSMQLELIRDEMDISINEVEKLGSPKAGHLGQLMDKVKTTNQASANPAAGIIKGIADWFGKLQPRQLGFAAMAALLVIVAQGLTIGNMMRSGENKDASYETASGPTSKTAARARDLKLLVTFNPDARASEVEKFLVDVNGSIVSGPKAGGLYEIMIHSMPLNKKAAQGIVDDVKKRRDIISSVLSGGMVTKEAD